MIRELLNSPEYFITSLSSGIKEEGIDALTDAPTDAQDTETRARRLVEHGKEVYPHAVFPESALQLARSCLGLLTGERFRKLVCLETDFDLSHTDPEGS